MDEADADDSSGSLRTTGDPVRDFRTLLAQLEIKSQEAYDKAILTLSGGALGVTISFVKDVVDSPTKEPGLLFASWVCWGISLSSVLFSHFYSQRALHETIKQLDAGHLTQEQAGGFAARTVEILNATSGLLFLGGTFAFVFFAYANLRG